ncbi:hypothetical protein ACTPOE_08340 [Castellaniella sp. WN]
MSEATLAQHESLLGHFSFLRSSAKSEYADRFELIIGMDQNQGIWAYRMNIAVSESENLTIEQQNLPIGTGETLQAFRNALMMAELDVALRQEDKRPPKKDDNPRPLLFKNPQPLLNKLGTHIRNIDQCNGANRNSASERLAKLAMIADTTLDEYGPESECSLDIDVAHGCLRASLSIGSRKNIGATTLDSREALEEALYLNQRLILELQNRRLASQTQDESAFFKSILTGMIDDSDARQALEERIRDTGFSSENFEDIRMVQTNPDIFQARFRAPNPLNKYCILEFSNRKASAGELRGARLQTLLSETSYDSMADFINSIRGSVNDDLVIMAANSARQTLNFIIPRIRRHCLTEPKALFKTSSEFDAFILQLNTKRLGALQVGKTRYRDVAALYQWWSPGKNDAPSPTDMSNLISHGV